MLFKIIVQLLYHLLWFDTLSVRLHFKKCASQLPCSVDFERPRSARCPNRVVTLCVILTYPGSIPGHLAMDENEMPFSTTHHTLFFFFFLGKCLHANAHTLHESYPISPIIGIIPGCKGDVPHHWFTHALAHILPHHEAFPLFSGTRIL